MPTPVHRGEDAPQPIRMGLLELYTSSILAAIPQHLRSSFTVKCAGQPALLKEMEDGELDIVCLFEPSSHLARDAVVWREDIVWVRSAHFLPPEGASLPVIGTDACEVHRAAVKLLADHGIVYRVVFEGSISLKIAAAKEGLGLLALPRWAIPPSLVPADELRLPPIPAPLAAICYRDGFVRPAADAFRAALGAVAAQFANHPAQVSERDWDSPRPRC